MNRSIRVLVTAVTCSLTVAGFQGCASYDEYRCGRGFYMRSGVCEGFGDGFTWQRFAPTERARISIQQAI